MNLFAVKESNDGLGKEMNSMISIYMVQHKSGKYIRDFDKENKKLTAYNE